jgi:hypothetical protein
MSTALDMCLVPELQAQIIYSLLYLEVSQCSCVFCALISPISTNTDKTSTNNFVEWSFKLHKEHLYVVSYGSYPVICQTPQEAVRMPSLRILKGSLCLTTCG